MKSHKKEVDREISGYGTGEITIQKLVFYNLLFFVPIIMGLAVSRILAGWLAPVFETTKYITVQILMLFFTVLIFMYQRPCGKACRSPYLKHSLTGFRLWPLTWSEIGIWFFT